MSGSQTVKYKITQMPWGYECLCDWGLIKITKMAPNHLEVSMSCLSINICHLPDSQIGKCRRQGVHVWNTGLNQSRSLSLWAVDP